MFIENIGIDRMGIIFIGKKLTFNFDLTDVLMHIFTYYAYTYTLHIFIYFAA